MARKKEAEFKLYAPQAKKVSVAGTFNNWDAKTLKAKKNTRGDWEASLSLAPGRYEYKFLVDGSWVDDPSCSYRVQNNFGTANCVIEIK